MCADGSIDAELSCTSFSIVNIKEVSPSCVKITTEVGPSFFIGLPYLDKVKSEQISINSVFLGEDAEDIFQASQCQIIEYQAIAYLSRAEQSHFQLAIKLQKKGNQKTLVEKVLNRLQNIGYLSDLRYASAFLRNRSINHTEGRTRLAAELASRNIDKNTANQALDEYMADNDERETFLRAVDKCRRTGKKPEKAAAYLQRCGFPFKYIKEYLQDSED